MRVKLLAAAGAAALLTLIVSPAQAAKIAVFGANGIGTYYAGLGNTVTYVTVGQLGTAGFLDSFDAFVMTRDSDSFGDGLSVAAAANVKSFVGGTGNIVLFNGDFADGLTGGDANTTKLFSNALSYVAAGGHGFIGEFNGAVSAFASNGDGLNPIGLVAGSAGVLGYGFGGSTGAINATSYGIGSPLLAGVSLPYNDNYVEFGSQLSGYNPAKVILAFDSGNPALIASNVQSISEGAGGVPEPVTWGLMLMGFAFAGLALRRARRQDAATTA
jgi:hypothetical protein